MKFEYYEDKLEKVRDFEKYNTRTIFDDEKMFERIDRIKREIIKNNDFRNCIQIFDRINDYIACREEVIIDGKIWIRYEKSNCI